MKLFLNILSAIGITVWTVAFFFGIHYLVSGAFEVSIPVALFLGVTLGVLINRLKYFSNKRNYVHRGYAKTAEMIALCVYVVVSLISSYYIIHCVAVATKYKTEVQKLAIEELDEIKVMINPSAISGSYKFYVVEQCGDYEKANPNNSSPETLNVEKAQLESLLMEVSGYKKLCNEMTDFWGYADANIRQWNWLYVGQYLTQLQTEKPKWEAALVECSRNGAEYSPVHYLYQPLTTNYPDIDKKITTASFSGITVWSILLILVLQTMILLTYLAYSGTTRQDSKKFEDRQAANIGSWQ